MTVLAWLERNQFFLLGGSGLLLLIALSIDSMTSEPAPDIVFHEGGTSVGGMIRVHVAGAVRSPGVYELAAGGRVEAAVLAAGGALDAGALDSINLARTLRDGERVVVPGASEGRPAALAVTDGLLDINSATASQLEALPGLGEAYSRRIVDSRQADGPFRSLDELVQRRVVPAATLEKARPFLTVSAP
jgi:competence protein ComEA